MRPHVAASVAAALALVTVAGCGTSDVGTPGASPAAQGPAATADGPPAGAPGTGAALAQADAACREAAEALEEIDWPSQADLVASAGAFAEVHRIHERLAGRLADLAEADGRLRPVAVSAARTVVAARELVDAAAAADRGAFDTAVGEVLASTAGAREASRQAGLDGCYQAVGVG